MRKTYNSLGSVFSFCDLFWFAVAVTSDINLPALLVTVLGNNTREDRLGLQKKIFVKIVKYLVTRKLVS